MMLKIREDDYVNMDNVRRIKIGSAVEVGSRELWPVEIHYVGGGVDTINVPSYDADMLIEKLDEQKDIPDESHKFIISLLDLMKSEKAK